VIKRSSRNAISTAPCAANPDGMKDCYWYASSDDIAFHICPYQDRVPRSALVAIDKTHHRGIVTQRANESPSLAIL
jgi:hypothetical protein